MKMNGAPGTEVSGAPTREVNRFRLFRVVASGTVESCYAQTFMPENQYLSCATSPEAMFGSYLVHEVLAENPEPEATWTGQSEWVDAPWTAECWQP